MWPKSKKHIWILGSVNFDILDIHLIASGNMDGKAIISSSFDVIERNYRSDNTVLLMPAYNEA